jgi:hypothetical protein
MLDINYRNPDDNSDGECCGGSGGGCCGGGGGGCC